jgi:stage V sporulation protein S
MQNPNYRVFKVSAGSDPSKIAGALAPIVRAAVMTNPGIKQYAELSCIGAGSINQAIKAIGIASGMVKPYGVDLACVPAFLDVMVKGEERTSIRLIVIRS